MMENGLGNIWQFSQLNFSKKGDQAKKEISIGQDSNELFFNFENLNLKNSIIYLKKKKEKKKWKLKRERRKLKNQFSKTVLLENHPIKMILLNQIIDKLPVKDAKWVHSYSIELLFKLLNISTNQSTILFGFFYWRTKFY